MKQTIILEPALAWSGALRRKVDASPDFGQWLEKSTVQALDRHRMLEWFV